MSFPDFGSPPPIVSQIIAERPAEAPDPLIEEAPSVLDVMEMTRASAVRSGFTRTEALAIGLGALVESVPTYRGPKAARMAKKERNRLMRALSKALAAKAAVA